MSWALWDPFGLGILFSGTSCLGSSGSNTSGGEHTHIPWGSATAPISLVVFLGSEAHSLHLRGHTAAMWASWGSARSAVSSGVGDASCWLSRGLISMASRMSSSLNHIRSVMCAWRSPAAPHITWYSPLDCWAQLCRTLARARVLSLHISQMFWEPLRLPGGRNLLCYRLKKLGGGSNQPAFLNWAAGSWKPTACFLACCCAFNLSTSLKHPWLRVRNSGHQVGGVLIPFAYTLTHFLGCFTRSGIQDVWCVSKSFRVAGPVDVAPLAVVKHCWSFFLFGMVIFGLTIGHVVKHQASHHSLVAPSDHLRKLVKWIAQIILVCEIKVHQLLCWALGWAHYSWLLWWMWAPHRACWSGSQQGWASSLPWELSLV